MNTVEVLKAAKALISDPAKWTQRSYARNAGGFSTCPTNGDAECWCSVGAIECVAGNSDLCLIAESKLCAAIGGGGIIRFNDMHTHSEVMAAFDRAIELAEADA